MTESKPVELLRDRRGIYGIGVRTRCAMTSNTEHKFAHTNRHLVEVPDTFAVARCSSSPAAASATTGQSDGRVVPVGAPVRRL